VRLNDTVQQLVDAGDWPSLVLYYAAAFGVPVPTIDWRSVLAVVWLALFLLTIRPMMRLWNRPRIPWNLGPVTVDLRGGLHTIHAVVSGMSGTGKSTAVLSLLMGKMPALVIAFDNSRPILMLFKAMSWTIWQPGGTLGWNILSGTPQVVSEALTAGFAKTDQDTGYNRGLAQMRLWETMEALDRSGAPRTIDVLVDALEQPGNNPDQTRACRTWANRFARIAKSLGPSLGTDLDLAEAMARGNKVLILPNRFLSPEDAPLVGAIALVQARRVAQEVGDFLIVVEEAGQAGSRQLEMNALAQAGRDRGCPLIVLTQNMAKLPEEVVNNVKVWVSFAQESKKELAFAAEHLRIEPEELQIENMPTGYAWVRSPDHNPRRVRLHVPRLPRPKQTYETAPTYLTAEPSTPRRYVVEEIGGPPAPVYPALPYPRRDVQEVLDKIDKPHGEQGCWLWKETATVDKSGYAIHRWAYPDGRPKNNRPAHQVVWEIYNGRWFIEGTWDHWRDCPKRCVSPYHGEPGVTLGENSKRMHRVRGHQTNAAD
jgi:hypothetical protein